MDATSSYNDIPWELIIPVLRGEQTPEEERAFREWMEASGDNRQQFSRLQEMWKEGLTDYAFYGQADEVVGWEALKDRMERGSAGQKKNDGDVVGERSDVMPGDVLQGDFVKKGAAIRRWVAAAAILLIVAGSGWWYWNGKTSATQYATAAGERRTVSLPDGSSIDLEGETRVRVTGDFNKTNRTVTLISGSARFAIVHQAKYPFVVDMEEADVKDIGTIFTVERAKDSIRVAVTEGKITFTDKRSGEARVVSAGGTVVFYTAGRRVSVTAPLRFDNARLADVVSALQEVSGRSIVLPDAAMAEQRLTVHLEGESFEDALKTVCASLGLTYTVENGKYILRNTK